jgi:hypothetical protein
LTSAGWCSLAVLLAVLVPVGAPADAAAPVGGSSATRAEVQVGLCAPFADIERTLRLRPEGGAIEVWLFDDAGLALYGRGIRLRLRVAEKRAELTLKIADQDCARLDPRLLPPESGKCEIDVHGERRAGAVSLSRRLTNRESSDLVARRVAPGDLLSPVQSAYLRDVVGIWPLPRDLRPLGPIQSRAYVTKGEPYDVDVSRLPAGEVFVEISRKVPAADAQRAKDALDAMLLRKDVAVCADQSAQAANKLKSMLR